MSYFTQQSLLNEPFIQHQDEHLNKTNPALRWYFVNGTVLSSAQRVLGRLLGRFVENANPGSLFSLDSLLSNGRGIGRGEAGTNLLEGQHPALEGR